jgi:hypothetical protein
MLILPYQITSIASFLEDKADDRPDSLLVVIPHATGLRPLFPPT